MRRLFSLFLLLLTMGGVAHATAPFPAAAVPDTAQLTLAEAEQRFAQNNLLLLAQRYNVSAAQAQILQARLWDNPTLSLEQNTYNPNTRRAFDVTQRGESIVQVQQLFAIAGRRKAAANVAQQGALVEQYNLEDLLRNLNYQVRTTFFDLYYKQQTVGTYNTEINSFQRTLTAYQNQYDKGNIALKEVIRLRAFLFDLQTERQALLSEIATQESDLRILLRESSGTYFRPTVNNDRLQALSLTGFSEEQLADTAQVARADLRARQADVEQQNQNLRLQRALAAPDLAVGYVYDRAGSYIQNYNAVTLGVAVPIFNRNQGNIRTAQAQIEQSRAQRDQQLLTVRNDVQEAWRQAQQTDALYQTATRNISDFTRLIQGIEQSYAKRNITIVEFLDFYESYKNNIVQLNQLRAARLRAFESLNFSVGRTVFNAE
ncbi:TolC family protein [Hymenobacter aerilatus]|uniref:TolC family protein n=1 Tax=Hymenobacter aerilatus TaxID=2932251 RepID=A0A8T9T0D7_9BACT|nr:TolC family protein [Hymenobacter aerilatus]UOR07595.1 TolC family protein [Hymenobacter aerilatus]